MAPPEPRLDHRATIHTLTNSDVNDLVAASKPYQPTTYERDTIARQKARIEGLRASVDGVENIDAAEARLRLVHRFGNHLKVQDLRHKDELSAARAEERQPLEIELAEAKGRNTDLYDKLRNAEDEISNLKKSIQIAAARLNLDQIDDKISLALQFDAFSEGVSSKKGNEKAASSREVEAYKKNLSEEVKELCKLCNVVYDQGLLAQTILGKCRPKIQALLDSNQTTRETLDSYRQAFDFIANHSRLSKYFYDEPDAANKPTPAAMRRIIDTAWDDRAKQTADPIFHEVLQLVSGLEQAWYFTTVDQSNGIAGLVRSLIAGAKEYIDLKDKIVTDVRDKMETAARHLELKMKNPSPLNREYTDQFIAEMGEQLKEAQEKAEEQIQDRMQAEQALQEVSSAVVQIAQKLTDVELAAVDQTLPDQKKALPLVESFIAGVTTRVSELKKYLGKIDALSRPPAPGAGDGEDEDPSADFSSMPVNAQAIFEGIASRISDITKGRDDWKEQLAKCKADFGTGIAPAARELGVTLSTTEDLPAVLFGAYKEGVDAKLKEVGEMRDAFTQHFHGAMADLNYKYMLGDSPAEKRAAFVAHVKKSLTGLERKIESTETSVKETAEKNIEVLGHESTDMSVEDKFKLAIKKLKLLDQEKKNIRASLQDHNTKHGLGIAEPTVENVISKFIDLKNEANHENEQVKADVVDSLGKAQPASFTPAPSDALGTRITKLIDHIKQVHASEAEQSVIAASQEVSTAITRYLEQISAPSNDPAALESIAIDRFKDWLRLELERLKTGCDADRENRATCIHSLYDGMTNVLETVGVQPPAALSKIKRTDRNSVDQWVEDCKEVAIHFTRDVYDDYEGASQHINAVVFELQNFARQVFDKLRIRQDGWPRIEASQSASVQYFSDTLLDKLQLGLTANSDAAAAQVERSKDADRYDIAQRIVPSVSMTDPEFYDKYGGLANEHVETHEKFAMWLDVQLTHVCVKFGEMQDDLRKAKQWLETVVNLVDLMFNSFHTKFELEGVTEDLQAPAFDSATAVAKWINKRAKPLILGYKKMQQKLSDNEAQIDKHKRDESRSIAQINTLLNELANVVDPAPKVDERPFYLSIMKDTAGQLLTDLNKGKNMPRLKKQCKVLVESRKQNEELVDFLVQQINKLVAAALDESTDNFAGPPKDKDGAATWFSTHTASLKVSKVGKVKDLEARVDMLHEGILKTAYIVNEGFYGEENADKADIPELKKDFTKAELQAWHLLFKEWYGKDLTRELREVQEMQWEHTATLACQHIYDLGLKVEAALSPVVARAIADSDRLIKLNMNKALGVDSVIGRIRRFTEAVAYEIERKMDDHSSEVNGYKTASQKTDDDLTRLGNEVAGLRATRQQFLALVEAVEEDQD